jgi:glucose/arabinose dehydrogenase
VFVAHFEQPMYLAAPPGDARLFVVERAGVIRMVTPATGLVATPFLDIRALVGTAGEGGLLGLAFSPNYATSREFYVYYTDLANDSVLARYQTSVTNRNVADPASREVVLLVDGPNGQANHRGGTIAFSPADGRLYWALGDGGSGGDLAQDPQSLLGKMLRLTVTGGLATYAIPADNPFVGPDGVRDEIWALGLRNPFRFSFDRGSGDRWIGDVGERSREEVNFEDETHPGGRNYGWPVHEGTLCFAPAPPGLPCEDPLDPEEYAFPLYEYPTHVAGTCSITGGVVYRGSNFFLQGTYLFADFCADRIYMRGPAGVQDVTASLAPDQGRIDGVVAFGQDGFGDVYVVSLISGDVHRIQ